MNSLADFFVLLDEFADSPVGVFGLFAGSGLTLLGPDLLKRRRPPQTTVHETTIASPINKYLR